MSPFQPLAEPDVATRAEVSVPRLYEVLLLNDDYTSMEFVVTILMNVFHKSADAATGIMLAVHRQGEGIAGVYPLEIAETKVDQVRRLAIEAQFPLRCVVREA